MECIDLLGDLCRSTATELPVGVIVEWRAASNDPETSLAMSNECHRYVAADTDARLLALHDGLDLEIAIVSAPERLVQMIGQADVFWGPMESANTWHLAAQTTHETGLCMLRVLGLDSGKIETPRLLAEAQRADWRVVRIKRIDERSSWDLARKADRS